MQFQYFCSEDIIKELCPGLALFSILCIYTSESGWVLAEMKAAMDHPDLMPVSAASATMQVLYNYFILCSTFMPSVAEI